MSVCPAPVCIPQAVLMCPVATIVSVCKVTQGTNAKLVIMLVYVQSLLLHAPKLNKHMSCHIK